MGKQQRLTTFTLSCNNLKKRSFRTKGLIIIVAVLAFAIFCGMLLTQSLNLGTNYMSGRMGADIMVVPRGCASKLTDTLLKSGSNTFYLKENPIQKISAMNSVQKVSPQLYIGSLNAACCTVPVQIIGFEPETDFTIKSWMTNFDSSKLGFGEVVTGNLVSIAPGNIIWLFGQPFKVVASLKNTGMGFNSSIFMTMETARNMIKLSDKTAVRPAGTEESTVSALFVKLADNANATKTAEDILSEYPQTDVIITKDMMSQISITLKNISGLIYGIQALLWLISVLVLAVVFTVSNGERQREFGLYLTLGATRRKLRSLILTETLIISVFGGLFGVMLGVFFMFDFMMLIATSLSLPYLTPNIGTTAELTAISLLLSVITGVASGLYSAKRAARSEPFVIVREFE